MAISSTQARLSGCTPRASRLRANTNRTLPLGVVNFQTEYATAYELLAAAQCITIAPLIIVYLVFQRHFVDGLSGSVKS